MPILSVTGEHISRNSIAKISKKYRSSKQYKSIRSAQESKSHKKFKASRRFQNVNLEYKSWRKSKKYQDWRNIQMHRQNYRCFYCECSLIGIVLNTEHVIPRKLGGTNELCNLVMSCRDCNKKKGNKMPKNKTIKRARDLSMS